VPYCGAAAFPGDSSHRPRSPRRSPRARSCGRRPWPAPRYRRWTWRRTWRRSSSRTSPTPARPPIGYHPAATTCACGGAGSRTAATNGRPYSTAGHWPAAAAASAHAHRWARPTAGPAPVNHSPRSTRRWPKNSSRSPATPAGPRSTCSLRRTRHASGSAPNRTAALSTPPLQTAARVSRADAPDALADAPSPPGCAPSPANPCRTCTLPSPASLSK
jgi:hypothetical protein